MYVYVIKAGDRCKVGKARNPSQRLSELQTGCPIKLELVASIQCRSDAHALHVEKLAHRVLRIDRRRGEWFAYSSQMQRFVATANQAIELRERVTANHRRLDREFWETLERAS